MKLINISNKYIKGDKKSTVLILTSIILATAMFLVVNIISEDARNIMIDQAKKELGMKHASYSEPADKEAENIKNNPNIDKVGEEMLLGLHDIGNSQTLQILYEDKVSEEINNSYKLKKGKYPTNENEIAIDTWYIEQKKIKEPIGKNIKLDYSKPDEKGHELYRGEKMFKIVGVLQSHSILKSQGMSMGVISKECAIKNIPTENKNSQVMFTFKKEKNIPKQVGRLIKDENLNKDKITLNNSLVLAMADTLSLKIPYMVINLVLALATILLIYNIFYILVSNRIKDFGTLRSVGFIPSDVSKIMILEVLLYMVISIPAGIILGSIISYLSREYIIGAIYNVNYANSVMSHSYISTYITTIFISIITIITAVLKPLILLSKIDPMVSIRRSNEKIVIKQKSFISKVMNRCFHEYGNIASKNIQRNKKRSYLAIISMSMVFILLTSLYSKTTSNFLNDGGLRWWIPGEYLLHNISMDTVTVNNKSYDKQTLQKIKSIDGIKKVKGYRDKHFSIKIKEKDLNKQSQYWKRDKEIIESRREVKNGISYYDNSIEVLGIEEIEDLENMVIDGDENLKKLTNSPYIYIDKEAQNTLNINKGDKIKVFFNTSDENTGNYEKTISKQFVVGGIIKHLPITAQSGTSFSGVISVNQFNKFTGIDSYERFDIWTSKLANSKNIDRELNDIIAKSKKGILIPYKNESATIEKSDNQKNLIMALVVGVVIILSLLNFCNVIATNIKNRKREFALLNGIGISNGEVRSIVKLEGLIYITVGILIGVIPTFTIRYLIIKPFESISLFDWKFIVAIMVISVILFLIMIVTTLNSLRNLEKEEFMEQIKILE